MELSLEKFSPAVADLQMLVQTTKQITITDFKDKEQVKAVHDNRIVLRDARNKIMKTGKEYRADALKFQKAVLAKERELVSIIEPEEQRLKELEEQADQMKIRTERIALLPERKKKLAEIDPEGTHDDEVLLSMDATEFQGYLNQKLAAKNEKARLELDAKERDLKERELAIQREKEAVEREERARQEERERIERGQKAEAERKKKEEEESAKRAEAERKARENSDAYKAFMAKYGLFETTKENLAQYYVLNDNTDPAHPKVKLYKLVDTLELQI